MTKMTVKELKEKLGLTEIALPDGNREVTGCYIGDLLSWVMGKAKSGDAWLTIMSNVNVVAVATLCDTACVILAEGVLLDEEVVKTARERGVNILSSTESAFDIANALGDIGL